METMPSSSTRTSSSTFKRWTRKWGAQRNNASEGNDEVSTLDTSSLGHIDLKHFRMQPFHIQVDIARAFLRKPTLLIDPRCSPWYEQWGLAIFFATGATALLTPLEVAFFAPSSEVDASFLFIVNRIMDLVFLFDMVFQFVLIYPEGGRQVKSWPRIALRYLRTWFVIDALALVPFTHLGLNGFRTARLLRCLRLLKLVRMVRGNRALASWKHRTTVSYATQDLLQTTISTVCLMHWMSCIFGMCADVPYETLHDKSQFSWVTELVRQGKLKPEAYSEPMVVYLYALYWTCATVTSVGYGDVAPRNPTEVSVSCVLIIMGAYFWAYVVGSFCNIVANFNPHGVFFKQRMDAVNFMLKDQACSPLLSKRIRAYMNHTMHLQRLKEYDKLRLIFSPQLQKEIANELCSREVSTAVPYFQKATRRFMVEVSRAFVPGLFSPCEKVFRPSALFIILHGIAVQNGVVVPSGSACNVGFVLTAPELQDRVVWVALGFVEVFSLERYDLDQVLRCCPEVDRKRIRAFTVRLAAQRGFILAAKALKKQRRQSEGADGKIIANGRHLATGEVTWGEVAYQSQKNGWASQSSDRSQQSLALRQASQGGGKERGMNGSAAPEITPPAAGSSVPVSPRPVLGRSPTSRLAELEPPNFLRKMLRATASSGALEEEDDAADLEGVEYVESNERHDFASLGRQLHLIQEQLSSHPEALQQLQASQDASTRRIEDALQLLLAQQTSRQEPLETSPPRSHTLSSPAASQTEICFPADGDSLRVDADPQPCFWGAGGGCTGDRGCSDRMRL